MQLLLKRLMNNTVNKEYFYKRKSHRTFSPTPLTKEELSFVNEVFNNAEPLIKDIKVASLIVKKEETSVSRGEYCLLVYSEKKDYYLENIGYILSQVDLILQQNNIGVCFLGMGRTKLKEYKGLPFCTMLNFGAMLENSLRNYLTDFKRNEPTKSLPYEIALPASLAPSACNSQPWNIKKDGKNIIVTRGCGNPSIMRGEIKTFFNKIDMGIYLYYLKALIPNSQICIDNSTISCNDDDKTIINYRTM